MTGGKVRFRFSLALAAVLVAAAGTVVLTCRQMVLNLAPAVPAIPSGPSEGRTDTLYQFVSMTTDPDGDDIALRFDWGDGDTSEWTAFQSSGDSARLWHMWTWSGDFEVRAQAKDDNGALSDWSEPLDVAVASRYRFPFSLVDSVYVEDWYFERMVPSRDGKYLYGIDPDDEYVIVIDATANVLADTIGLDECAYAVDACLSPDNQFLYVTDNDRGVVMVLRLADKMVVAEVPVGYYPSGIDILPSGEFVYVGFDYGSYVKVIRTSDNTVVDSIEAGSEPMEVEVTQDGEYVCVLSYYSEAVSVIRTSDNSVTAEEPARCYPWCMTVAGSDRLYVTSDDEGVIEVFTLPELGYAGQITVPFEWVSAIDATPDGKYVYFAEDGYGNVGVIATESDDLLGFVALGDWAELISIVCMPDGERVYATSGDEYIWMLGYEEEK
jgi:DNA-binding beta-propeller fold protein YncE